MLISATYQDAVRELERTQFLARGLVDGVLMVAPALEDATLEALRRKNLPCVVIDPRRTDVSLPRVTVDNYGGIRQAAEHLLELGHTRIAYIKGIADLESSELRYKGFHDALRLAGVDLDERLVAESDFTYTQGFRITSALIARAPADRPDGRRGPDRARCRGRGPRLRAARARRPVRGRL